MFAKHLAVMIKAGMPLLDSLRLLQKQLKSKMMKRIIEDLIQGVSNGQFLSTVMEKYKNVFGDFTVNIIKVGETSGILYENLNYLAVELKKKEDSRKKVVGALIYPIIVLVMSTAVIGVLTIYVFPKILPVLKGLKTTPPLPTRILIAITNFTSAYGIYAALGVLIFIVIIWFLVTKVKSIKFLFHKIILATPLAGQISQNYSLIIFTRTLGLLLKSGIKIVEAFSITADTMGNLVYKSEIKQMIVLVTKGEEISKHLELRPQLFPLVLSAMITIGERTGNLSESLLYLSELYESELDDLTRNLTVILEPALMVVLGVVVGFIALAVIVPIYQVTQHI